MSSTKEISQFNELKAAITALVAPTSQVTVTDFASSNNALEVCKQVKSYINQVEAKRKDLVGPLNDEVKRINSFAKDVTAPLLEAERHIKAQIVRFEEVQEQVRAEERRKAEEIRIAEERKAREEAEKAAAELRAKQEEEREREVRVTSMFGADDEEGPQESLEERQAREQAEFQAKLDQEAALRTVAAKQREFDIKQQGTKGIQKKWRCEIIDPSKVPAAFLIVSLNEPMVLAAARGGQTEIPGVRLWQEMIASVGRNSYVPRATLEKEKAKA